uniref:Uncharacterized protein n=1 Tax=Plectus sambesii TaxID=2011161 RepID=A0A914W2M9_9BILA
MATIAIADLQRPAGVGRKLTRIITRSSEQRGRRRAALKENPYGQTAGLAFSRVGQDTLKSDRRGEPERCCRPIFGGEMLDDDDDERFPSSVRAADTPPDTDTADGVKRHAPSSVLLLA